MDKPVSLALWSKTDATHPDHEHYVWTNVGETVYWAGAWTDVDGEDPTWWCDPKPPRDGQAPGGLTLQDLQLAQIALDRFTQSPLRDSSYDPKWKIANERLRAALEDLGK